MTMLPSPAGSTTDALARLFDNDDGPMLATADAALKYVDTLPNDQYAIHEASPNAAGHRLSSNVAQGAAPSPSR